ncbi:MAG: sigma-70 family RNA polymerase sigma factor [Erysipelotrichaceae bacterium]|nr:sigma-70 family RNA polymerase sigma factor [Erysipelotrichaceae bacterium]
MEIEEMIIEVQKGNEEYFPVILKEYQHMIYKIISAYRLTQGDFFISKDDLYQEACLALHEACLGFQEDRGVKFSSFAYVVIKRRVSRIYHSYRTVYRREPSSIDARETMKETMTEEKREQETLDLQVMESFMRRLCEEDKKILEMRLSRKGYKEIAEELGISSKRVDNRIYRMRKNYREVMKKQELPLYRRISSPLTKEV